MQRVIIDKKEEETINLSSVGASTPIFAKRNGKLKGMIIREDGRGWILKISATCGCSGHFTTLKGCIISGESYGYEFWIVKDSKGYNLKTN